MEAVFVDLSAAYDTVNLRRLMCKVVSIMNDHKFVRMLRELLQNRRSGVHLLSNKSRWKAQKTAYLKVVSWHCFQRPTIQFELVALPLCRRRCPHRRGGDRG